MGLLMKWLILSVAFWATAKLLPGVRVNGFGSSILAAAIYAVLSVIVGWVLFAVLTIGTLGIAYLLGFITWWFIGAVVLLLTDELTDSFDVDGFGAALIASAVIAGLNAFGHWGVTELLG